MKRENIAAYFKKASEECETKLYKSIKPFVTNTGTHRNEEYILEENGDLIRYPIKVSIIFNINLIYTQILLKLTQIICP